MTEARLDDIMLSQQDQLSKLIQCVEDRLKQPKVNLKHHETTKRKADNIVRYACFFLLSL